MQPAMEEMRTNPGKFMEPLLLFPAITHSLSGDGAQVSEFTGPSFESRSDPESRADWGKKGNSAVSRWFSVIRE